MNSPTFAAYSISGVLGVGLSPVAAVDDAIARGHKPPLRITIAQATPDLVDVLYAQGYDAARVGELSNGLLGTELEYAAEMAAERERRKHEPSARASWLNPTVTLGRSVIRERTESDANQSA